MEEKAGVGRTTLGRHERGTQKPLFPTIRKYATALAVDEEDIDFPQWPEDYISNLEIPSEIKGSNENQFETEDGSLLNEDEIEANEILITDPRIVNQLELTSKPIEKPQPQPETKPEQHKPNLPLDDKPELETTPTQTGKVVSPISVEPKDDVEEIEPSKGGGAGVVIFLIVVGVVALASHLLVSGYRFLSRKDAGRIETTLPSNGEVKLSKDEMIRDFMGHL